MKLGLIDVGKQVHWTGVATQRTCRKSGGCGCGGSKEVCKNTLVEIDKPQVVTVVSIDRLDEHKNVMVKTKAGKKHWVGNASLSMTTITEDTKTVEYFDLHAEQAKRKVKVETVHTVEHVYDTVAREATMRA